jgi:hypothetical protein
LRTSNLDKDEIKVKIAKINLNISSVM